MTYIKAPTVPADVPNSVPLIGYDNVVTSANITSSTAASGFPVSNLANPATHLKWRAGVNTGDEFITINTGLKTTINYLGIAKHNFGSGAVLVALEYNDPAQILLHFDGADASTTVIDSNSIGAAHTWTVAGNAQLDNAQSKFGGTSLLLDGTGDLISTADNPDFTIGAADYTIDFWLRAATVVPGDQEVFLHATDVSNYHRGALVTNQFRYVINIGAVFYIDLFSGLLNANQWYHIAITRSGTTFRFFLDGVLITSAISTVGLLDFTGTFNIGTTFNGWLDEFRLVIGSAIWTASFTPPKSPYGWHQLVNGSSDDSQVMLHFDGADASTAISDSNNIGSDHLWTAAGNAQIDTATSKFGGASLLLDGTGDSVSTPQSPDFDLGSEDFTIDTWFNCNSVGSITRTIAGQYDGTVAGSAWAIVRTITNVIAAILYQGAATQNIITGTTVFTNSVNTGWHHVAFVRTGNTLKLFIDGVQEGGNLSISGAANDSTTVLRIGSSTTGDWLGWIDEFRLTISIARWTTGFTVPASASQSGTAIVGDNPILFRWPSLPIAGLRLRLRPDAAAPEAAVIYAGTLLALERSITIDSKHVPVTYGRRTNVINGMSETGNFLGRIVLGEYRESKAEFEWFRPDFYRSSIDAFLDAAQERPFFWVWNPDEYPEETGYVWLTNNAEPETDPVTRRVALDLEMRGIA